MVTPQWPHPRMVKVMIATLLAVELRPLGHGVWLKYRPICDMTRRRYTDLR
jgi:hypothetical protein